MTVMDLEPTASPIRTAHDWLDEVCVELGWKRDARRAYQVLCAVLHVLRDALPAATATRLAAHLPLVVRTFFDEDARPAHNPPAGHTIERLLASVAGTVSHATDVSPHAAARAVFAVLARRLPSRVAAEVRRALPAPVRHLFV